MNTSVQTFRKNILRWYHAHRRDLPWRRTRDPYAIWISEVMLQQTQVDTVIPYYERFLKRFPTLASLALADEGDVMKHWEGLGYYRRARHLHEAAKMALAQHGGALPKDAKTLRTLKGFGPYTSASVASIAFGEPIACVDGNVRRVVSRLFETHTDLDVRAQELVFANDPSSHNQAMMELGALICTPKAPLCAQCPVSRSCCAYKHNSVAHYPAKLAKAKVDERLAFLFALEHPRKGYRLIQRQREETWAGLWTFPFYEFSKTLGLAQAMQEAQARLALDMGIDLEGLRPHGSFTHVLTHRRYDVYVASVDYTGDISLGEFVPEADLAKWPLPRLMHKALNLLEVSFSEKAQSLPFAAKPRLGVLNRSLKI